MKMSIKKLLIVSMMFLVASISYFFWESTLPVKALGPVDPSTVTSGNINVMIWGKNSTGGNVWVGCILKPVDGTWTIIGGNHQNVGCAGVSQDSDSIDITYSAYSKIVSFSVDEMVGDNYDIDSSVGLSYSIITIGN